MDSVRGSGRKKSVHIPPELSFQCDSVADATAFLSTRALVSHYASELMQRVVQPGEEPRAPGAHVELVGSEVGDVLFGKNPKKSNICAHTHTHTDADMLTPYHLHKYLYLQLTRTTTTRAARSNVLIKEHAREV